MILFFAFMLYTPTRDWYVALRQGQDLQEHYDALAAENSLLSSDLDRLQSREGIEDEARRRGYINKGETSVVVENLPQELEESPSATDEEADATDGRSVGTRLLDFFFGYSSMSDE